VVGLTGGLASGKSTVARCLAERDTPVLDADRIVHDLYRPGAAGARAVAEIFGPGVLDRHGGVDRSLLGGRVLRDQALRLALENAVHPLVRQEITGWIDGLGDVSAAVIEAALLVETGSYRSYDALVVVWCRREQQLERALARGIPEERARALLDAQLSLDDKRAVADVVIDNSGSESNLLAEIERAWSEVARVCADRAPRAPRPADRRKPLDQPPL
jgi:dephospho-CoA kinase